MPRNDRNAAHGGSDWSPRKTSLREEIGDIWKDCGVATEWSPVKTVLMHRPGREIETIQDADNALMLSIPESILAKKQHDHLVETYRENGVEVYYLEPHRTPPPNQMFVADLFFMTPEGAILARPASTVRAGEELFVAHRLTELEIPILRYVRGRGVFEGADACWINPETVILATGLRTNRDGADQVTSLLHEMEVEVVRVKLPPEAMHLMGTLRFIDQDLAVGWRSCIPDSAVNALTDRGYTVLFPPDEEEAIQGMALNFVTLSPNRILMPSGNPKTQTFYQDLGVKCSTVEINEIHKAAGGIGCLTGILKRET